MVSQLVKHERIETTITKDFVQNGEESKPRSRNVQASSGLGLERRNTSPHISFWFLLFAFIPPSGFCSHLRQQRFPFVCVSIGLTTGKVPTVGVVYNTIMDELFTAIRGKGAFLNGNPIQVSSKSDLVNCLLVTEVGTTHAKSTIDTTTNRINSLLFKVRSLQMVGSCALDLCGIACGKIDLMYKLGYGGPWDVAVGVVIVEEAGGVIFDLCHLKRS